MRLTHEWFAVPPTNTASSPSKKGRRSLFEECQERLACNSGASEHTGLGVTSLTQRLVWSCLRTSKQCLPLCISSAGRKLMQSCLTSSLWSCPRLMRQEKLQQEPNSIEQMPTAVIGMLLTSSFLLHNLSGAYVFLCLRSAAPCRARTQQPCRQGHHCCRPQYY